MEILRISFDGNFSLFQKCYWQALLQNLFLRENRIKELCNKSGMNESDIVRNLIMGNDIKEAPSNKFYEVVRDLRSISNNINQLTRKAHSLGFIDEREYREEVIKLDILIDDLKLQFLNKNIAGNK